LDCVYQIYVDNIVKYFDDYEKAKILIELSMKKRNNLLIHHSLVYAANKKRDLFKKGLEIILKEASINKLMLIIVKAFLSIPFIQVIFVEVISLANYFRKKV
jgi:hypothetical protein